MSGSNDPQRTTPFGAAALPPSARPPHRARHIVIAVAAAGLILSGAGAAYAATISPTPAPGSGSSSSSTARPAPQPHIDGTVSSVSGNTVTVTDRDGFTRTILTSSATTYGTGLSASLAAGTSIHAVGTVDANHTSLDASAITIPPVGHGGKHGGQGTKPTPPAGTSGTPTAPSGTTPPTGANNPSSAPSGGGS